MKRQASMSPDKPRDLCIRTFQFSKEVVTFCLSISQKSAAGRQLSTQLMRSATSVGANAEEARAAFTRREFACKNSIVLKEAREARFWLRLIAANKLSTAEAIEPLLREVNELVGIYTATVRRARLPLKLET